VERPEFGRAEHERVDVGEVAEDLADPVLGLMLDGRIGRRDDEDDLAEALDVLKRTQTRSECTLGIDGGRVIVGKKRVVGNAPAATGPEGRNDQAGCRHVGCFLVCCGRHLVSR